MCKSRSSTKSTKIRDYRAVDAALIKEGEEGGEEEGVLLLPTTINLRANSSGAEGEVEEVGQANFTTMGIRRNSFGLLRCKCHLHNKITSKDNLNNTLENSSRKANNVFTPSSSNPSHSTTRRNNPVILKRKLATWCSLSENRRWSG